MAPGKAATHPALTSTASTAAALAGAIPPLTALAGDRLTARPEPPTLAQAAAGRAALADVRGALQNRAPTQPAHLQRPAQHAGTGGTRA